MRLLLLACPPRHDRMQHRKLIQFRYSRNASMLTACSVALLHLSHTLFYKPHQSLDRLLKARYTAADALAAAGPWRCHSKVVVLQQLLVVEAHQISAIRVQPMLKHVRQKLHMSRFKGAKGLFHPRNLLAQSKDQAVEKPLTALSNLNPLVWRTRDPATQRSIRQPAPFESW